MNSLASGGLAAGRVRADGAIEGVRGLGGLVTALTVLLPLNAATGVMFGFAALRRGRLLDEIIDSRVATEQQFAEIDAADSFVFTSLLINNGALLVTGVVFIVWFWRLAKNAQLLNAEKAPSPGWTIGSWFIPLFQLWLPALNLVRADRASDRQQPGNNRAIIACWAIAFDIAFVASRILGRLQPSEPATLDEARLFVTIDRSAMFAELAWVTAAVLAVVMVRRLTQRQRAALDDVAQVMRVAEESSAARLAAASTLPGYSAPIEPGTGQPGRPADTADLRLSVRDEADQSGPDPGRD